MYYSSLLAFLEFSCIEKITLTIRWRVVQAEILVNKKKVREFHLSYS